MQLLSNGDYVGASLELRNALKRKENMPAAWLALARIEEHHQNRPAVAAHLRNAVRQDPKDIETKLKLARLMLLGNARDEAAKLADDVLLLNDRHAGALALKAAILLQRNDRTGALREAQKAREIDPVNAEALIVLAAERATGGDVKGALDLLDLEVSSEQPNHGSQLFKIRLLEQLGDLRQLDALLQKLVDLYPQEVTYRRLLAQFYDRQERVDDATAQLRAIAATSSSPDAIMAVVQYLSAKRGPQAARQELLERIAAGGAVFPYQIALAEHHAAQGNIDDSVLLLQGLIANAATTPDQVLTAQGKLAALYIATKRLQPADALVADMLRKDSRNTAALRLRAAIRLERGQTDPAIADLRQALNDQPRAADVMQLLATAYERSGSIELADKQYAEALRASGLDAGVGLAYVGFLQRRGGAARATDMLTDLAARWPDNVQVLSALAGARLASHDWTGAEETANALRRLGVQGIPDQIQGEALLGLNRVDQSIAVLQSAYSEASGGAVTPMLSLVRAYLRTQQADKAVAFLQNELKKNPANADVLVLLGSVQLLSNAPADAQKSFMTAIERQPKNAAGYQALANFHVRQNQPDEALKVIRAGLAELPADFVLRMTLASVLELKKDYEGAIAEYEALLKAQPGSLIVANNLASLLSDQRADKASIDRAYKLTAALQKSPLPHFKDTIGWVHYRRGDFKAALTLLEQAAAELPDQPIVHYHLGANYIAIGAPDKAAEPLRKALKLASNDAALQDKVRAALKQMEVN
jgi:tetratricopeptide (TPR) repeat protein